MLGEHFHPLVDTLIRQTMTFVAQLATTGGARTRLAHIPDQVFIELVKALRRQGLGHKVIAGMFGMKLRTYHDHYSKIAEHTPPTPSCSDVVFELIAEQGPITPPQVVERLPEYEQPVIRGVIRDLKKVGIVEQVGRGDDAPCQAVFWQDDARGADLASLLWAATFRRGPAPLPTLLQTVATEANPQEALAAMDDLVAQGRVGRRQVDDEAVYFGHGPHVPSQTAERWSRAVSDQIHAVVNSLLASHRQWESGNAMDSRIGGAMVTFYVSDEHPHVDRVMGLLKKVREEAFQLYHDINDHNATHPAPTDLSVDFYVGQSFRPTFITSPEDS